MIRYRTEKIERQVVDSVVCNKCGQEVDLEWGGEHTTIQHFYGYGSCKDGNQFLSHVCETCMDEFYDTFTIPPQIDDGFV